MQVEQERKDLLTIYKGDDLFISPENSAKSFKSSVINQKNTSHVFLIEISF